MDKTPEQIAVGIDADTRRVMLSGTLNGENLSLGFAMCGDGLITPHVHRKTDWAVTFTKTGEAVRAILQQENTNAD